VKKPYQTPRFEVFGPISIVTEASGYASDEDQLWMDGQLYGGITTGSGDIYDSDSEQLRN